MRIRIGYRLGFCITLLGSFSGGPVPAAMPPPTSNLLPGGIVLVCEALVVFFYTGCPASRVSLSVVARELPAPFPGGHPRRKGFAQPGAMLRRTAYQRVGLQCQ